MIEDYLKDNVLLICPNEYKEKILLDISNKKIICNIKYMTIDEYKKNYYFDYSIDAIYYLINKYNMKVDNARDYLDNLYYVSDKCYHNKKLDYLVSLKKELEENNLLIYNPLFKNSIINYQVVIYGYGNLDDYTLKMFNNPIVISNELKKKKYNIYHFNDIEEEVEYLFNEISLLLQKGIDINNIYIMNAGNEYIPYLKRFSKFYDIGIEINLSDTIFGTKLGKEFYDFILDGLTSEEIFNKLDKYREGNLYSSLVNILNKYVDYNLLDVKDLIKDDLEKTLVYEDIYHNVIKLIDINSLVTSSDYVFLIGFNNGSIPVFKNDTDYITDNTKDLVGLPKTVDYNNLIKSNTLSYLSSIDNLFISYKDFSPFNNYYPSILLDDMDYELKDYPLSYSFSNTYNKIKYAYKLDDFVKYGLYNIDINDLYATYREMNYRKYDNIYHNIDRDSLISYLGNKLTLSYSHIDNYYKCGFRYYLSNILNIDIYEESFQAIVGSLFHDVLRHYRDDDFDFEERYNIFLKDKEFNNKEKFFLKKLKEDLKFIIKTINEFNMLTGFNDELYEEKINIILKENPLVEFKGFIDKIMYKKNNNETLVSIIDYKTGNPNVDIKNIKYGLSLQLPVYLYLMKNSNIFNNIKFAGFYLQHILNNEIKIDNKKSYDEKKRDNLKLAGYSTNDLSRLSIFDSSYENSQMIKSIVIKQDGTLGSRSKCLSDDEIDSIINLVDDKVHMAMNDILNAKFDINPKVINDENVGCMYCNYRDICYLKDKNLVYLEDGDNDAKLD